MCTESSDSQRDSSLDSGRQSSNATLAAKLIDLLLQGPSLRTHKLHDVSAL